MSASGLSHLRRKWREGSQKLLREGDNLRYWDMKENENKRRIQGRSIEMENDEK